MKKVTRFIDRCFEEGDVSSALAIVMMILTLLAIALSAFYRDERIASTVLFSGWATTVAVSFLIEKEARRIRQLWHTLSKNYAELNEKYSALGDFKERFTSQHVVDIRMYELAMGYIEACEDETKSQGQGVTPYARSVATERRILADKMFQHARAAARGVGHTAREHARDYLG